MYNTKKMITIITKNHKGLVADVSEILSEKNININNIEAQVYNENAVLHIEINESLIDIVLSLLTKAGYQAISDEVILICIPDIPGSLANIARKLSNSNIEIKGITSMWRNDGIVMVVLNTDENIKARQILQDILV